jgi:hypothetical protein
MQAAWFAYNLTNQDYLKVKRKSKVQDAWRGQTNIMRHLKNEDSFLHLVYPFSRLFKVPWRGPAKNLEARGE